MRGLFTNQSLVIPAGQAVSGIAGRTQTLHVVHGHVWITVEGMPHDYWLSAGDTFDVTPGRLIVVEADPAGGHAAATIEHKQSAIGMLAAQLRRIAQRTMQRSCRTNVKTGAQRRAVSPCGQQMKHCA